VFILKVVKVLCFDTLLEVFILKGLRYQQNCAERGGDSEGVAERRSDKKNVGRFDGPFGNSSKRKQTFGSKEGTPLFFVSVADKGLSDAVSALESTLAGSS